MPWTLNELAEALDLEAGESDFIANDIQFDSREVKPGDIFICFAGEADDGHNYISSAIQNGASLIILERSHQQLISTIPSTTSYIVVDNAQAALEKFAKFKRNKMHKPVIAITGSVGKTTTRKFLEETLAAYGEVVASPKSYNNHRGVPFSLARLKATSEFGVFEAGMNHQGELTPLSYQIKPDIAIITTIGTAHIGNLGGRDQIAQEKCTIFDGITPNGTAIIGTDQDYFEYAFEEAEKRNIKNIITFGSDEKADIRFFDVKITPTQTSASFQIGTETFSLTLNCVGRQYIEIAAICLSVMKSLNLSYTTAIEALNKIQPESGRGLVRDLSVQEKSITLIDDSYNANLQSMKSGLEILSHIGKDRRCVAILGEMRELGNYTKNAHIKLADFINKTPLSLLITIGKDAKTTSENINNVIQTHHFESFEQVNTCILDFLQDGDVLLIKGANGQQLFKIIDFLDQYQKKAA